MRKKEKLSEWDEQVRRGRDETSLNYIELNERLREYRGLGDLET
jgi:hypothetical protein